MLFLLLLNFLNAYVYTLWVQTFLFISDCSVLFNKCNNTSNPIASPESNCLVQDPDVSSSEKDYKTRLRVGHTKQNLFRNNINDEDYLTVTLDTVTSNVEDETDPNVKSDDEYIPDSDTPDSETDSDSFPEKDKMKISDTVSDKDIKKVKIQGKVRKHVYNFYEYF